PLPSSGAPADHHPPLTEVPIPEKPHGPPPLVHVTPLYLAGGPYDFTRATAVLANDHGWTRVQHMNGIREARSPCGQALVTDRRRGDDRVLSIDVFSAGHPRWHAAISAHTPEEISLTLVDAMARLLREHPDQALGPAEPAAAYRPREPAPGWSLAFDHPDVQLHSSPDGLAAFTTRRAHPTDTQGPRADPPGYYLIAGPGLSPHRWSVTLSTGAPPELLDLLHTEFTHPGPARRSANTIPVHHLPHVTIRSIDESSPARSAALLHSILQTTAEPSIAGPSPRPGAAHPTGPPRPDRTRTR
ncbi:hypothetical protein, partial [Kitasatospora sp. NPDC057015]|uniref:hypothetical protein n=1 Tax=Kitasatospora sp. NPDC057015 TaxID=3346001 RepID=UPI00362F5289